MNTLSGVTVFLDTSPLIYLVEVKEPYHSMMVTISAKLKNREIQAVTSPITLAECLIHPIRTKNAELVRKFRSVIVHGGGIKFTRINSKIGELAAQIRAIYNLQLKQVTEISVVCLDDFL